MSPARRLQVSWSGQVVGYLLNPEDETVLIPWVRTVEGDRQLGAPFLAKLHGRWVAADGPAASEFLSSLKRNKRPEVQVLPYSQSMKVLFSLAADGTGWLHCTRA
jgi:hypothetical protein